MSILFNLYGAFLRWRERRNTPVERPGHDEQFAEWRHQPRADHYEERWDCRD